MIFMLVIISFVYYMAIFFFSRVDIPILPTVSAKITFQEFKFLDSVPENLFLIPVDYREDQNR